MAKDSLRRKEMQRAAQKDARVKEGKRAKEEEKAEQRRSGSKEEQRRKDKREASRRLYKMRKQKEEQQRKAQEEQQRKAQVKTLVKAAKGAGSSAAGSCDSTRGVHGGSQGTPLAPSEGGESVGAEVVAQVTHLYAAEQCKMLQQKVQDMEKQLSRMRDKSSRMIGTRSWS